MLKSKDYSKAEGYASLAKALGNTATNELVSHTVKTSSVNDLEMPGNLLKLECENSVENLATFIWQRQFGLQVIMQPMQPYKKIKMRHAGTLCIFHKHAFSMLSESRQSRDADAHFEP